LRPTPFPPTRRAPRCAQGARIGFRLRLRLILRHRFRRRRGRGAFAADGIRAHLAVAALAIADRPYLSIRQSAGTDEVVAHGVGAGLAEALIERSVALRIGEALNRHHGIAATAERACEVIEQRLVLIANGGIADGEVRARVDTDAVRHFGHEGVVLAPQLDDLGLQALAGGAQVGDGAVEIDALHAGRATGQYDGGYGHCQGRGTQDIAGHGLLLSRASRVAAFGACRDEGTTDRELTWARFRTGRHGWNSACEGCVGTLPI
jgi:hypothetical protein